MSGAFVGPMVLPLVERVVVLYFSLFNAAIAALLLLAIRELARHWHVADDARLASVLTSQALPPLSVLVTVDDPAVLAASALRELLTLEYPRHEIVLVTDGVPDAIAQELALYAVPPAIMVSIPTSPVRGYYRSHASSKLLVIDKEHTSRADALNAAVNAARYPYVLAVRAGTQLLPDALLRLARPVLLGEPAFLVTSAVRVAGDASRGEHAPRSWLAGVQAVESLRDRTYAHLGANALGGALPPVRSINLYLRDHALAQGGYRASALEEEADLALRVRQSLRDQAVPDRIHMVPEALAFGAAPSQLGDFTRARDMERRGQLRLLAASWGSDGRHAGGTAWRSMPLLALRALLSPVMEVLGYVCAFVALAVGAPVGAYVALVVLAAYVYPMLLAWWCIGLEHTMSGRRLGARDTILLGLWAAAEPLGYRQIAAWLDLRALLRSARDARRGVAVASAPLAGRTPSPHAAPPG